MNSINTFWWETHSVSSNFRCLYLMLREQNAIAKKTKMPSMKGITYIKNHKLLLMKLNDPAKNAERLKK